MRARLYLLPLPVAYMGFIYYMSAQSALPIPYAFEMQDKLMHFLAYGLLALLWCLVGLKEENPKLRFWLPLLLSSLYGASDEIHQYFVPGRSCEFLDWLADGSGALSAAAAYTLAFPRIVKLKFFRNKAE